MVPGDPGLWEYLWEAQLLVGGLLVPPGQVWVTPESQHRVVRVRVMAAAGGTEYFSTSDP